MKNSCEVLQDIYPNYIDGICSEKSKELVEEHLKECESCRELIKDMARDMKEIKLEEDPEDKLSKKILVKVAGKKYFTAFMVALLFFLSGFYSIFTSESRINLYTSPERALKGHTQTIDHNITNKSEIVYMEEIDKNLYAYIFEDSTGFGVGMVKKRLGGLLWSSRGNSSLSFHYKFTPFYHSFLYNNYDVEVIPYVVRVKDPNIQYVVLDRENEWLEAAYDEEIITFEDVKKDTDRFFSIAEVQDGYAIFYEPFEKVSDIFPRAFTADGIEINQVKYRIIQDGGVQSE